MICQGPIHINEIGPAALDEYADNWNGGYKLVVSTSTLYIKAIGGADLDKLHARRVVAIQCNPRIRIHKLSGKYREAFSRSLRRPIKYAVKTRFHDHVCKHL